MRDGEAERIARDLLAMLGTGRQLEAPLANRADFGLAEAYKVAGCMRALRETRGERPVGRKIGFTNTTAWAGYGISGPMWNYVFDSTVRDLADGASFDLAGLAEPRIEPEIVLHLCEQPRAGMNEGELLECVDWIAHGFEIVHSVFPGWTFTAAEAAAAFGVHGALLLGGRHDIRGDRTRWAEQLAGFSVELLRNGGPVAEGHARNVLGGPLTALRFLVDELARTSGSPLAAGEIVTTGTLTAACPAVSGDDWSTELGGIEVRGIRIRLL
jgi:2-keto-4-pentenoate hydratase